MKYLAIFLSVGTVLLSGSLAAQTNGAATSGVGGAVADPGSAAGLGLTGGAGTTSSPATGSAARTTVTTTGVTTPSLTCSQADLLDSAAVTLGCQ